MAEILKFPYIGSIGQPRYTPKDHHALTAEVQKLLATYLEIFRFVQENIIERSQKAEEMADVHIQWLQQSLADLRSTRAKLRSTRSDDKVKHRAAQGMLEHLDKLIANRRDAHDPGTAILLEKLQTVVGKDGQAEIVWLREEENAFMLADPQHLRSYLDEVIRKEKERLSIGSNDKHLRDLLNDLTKIERKLLALWGTQPEKPERIYLAEKRAQLEKLPKDHQLLAILVKFIGELFRDLREVYHDNALQESLGRPGKVRQVRMLPDLVTYLKKLEEACRLADEDVEKDWGSFRAFRKEVGMHIARVKVTYSDQDLAVLMEQANRNEREYGDQPTVWRTFFHERVAILTDLNDARRNDYVRELVVKAVDQLDAGITQRETELVGEEQVFKQKLKGVIDQRIAYLERADFKIADMLLSLFTRRKEYWEERKKELMGTYHDRRLEPFFEQLATIAERLEHLDKQSTPLAAEYATYEKTGTAILPDRIRLTQWLLAQFERARDHPTAPLPYEKMKQVSEWLQGVRQKFVVQEEAMEPQWQAQDQELQELLPLLRKVIDDYNREMRTVVGELAHRIREESAGPERLLHSRVREAHLSGRVMSGGTVTSRPHTPDTKMKYAA
ncbi:hypothetical protein HYW21_09390 [Candidatus Woesearchaeota archaeon]|nr:hypothetical protein [Candidatus Woesearchaeota archaeon]